MALQQMGEKEKQEYIRAHFQLATSLMASKCPFLEILIYPCLCVTSTELSCFEIQRWIFPEQTGTVKNNTNKANRDHSKPSIYFAYMSPYQIFQNLYC